MAQAKPLLIGSLYDNLLGRLLPFSILFLSLRNLNRLCWCPGGYEECILFSLAKIEGIEERRVLRGASVHIKGFGSTPIPLQRQISTEMIGATIPSLY